MVFWKPKTDFHAAGNELKDSIRLAAEAELLAETAPYESEIDTYLTTTLPDWFDSIHAFGFTEYDGFGVGVKNRHF